MNTIKISAIGVVTLLALVVGVSAGADDATQCKDRIDEVSITGASNFDTETIADLNTLLEGASLALVQKDYVKALSQLKAYEEKVGQLSFGEHPKISKEDATPLLEKVSRAHACVEGLVEG